MASTPEGKAVSRMNALKHGLRATDELFLAHLRPDERAILDELRDSFHTQYLPQTDHEKLIVDRIAIQYFRLFRLYKLEYLAANQTSSPHKKLKRSGNPDSRGGRVGSISSGTHHPSSFSSVIPHLDRFARYDWRIERQLRVLHNHLRCLYLDRGDHSLSLLFIRE